MSNKIKELKVIELGDLEKFKIFSDTEPGFEDEAKIRFEIGKDDYEIRFNLTPVYVLGLVSRLYKFASKRIDDKKDEASARLQGFE